MSEELMALRGEVAAIERSQALIEFALDGTVLRANENFLTVVGYSLDEVLGKHHRLFVDEAERESLEYRRFWQRLAQGEYHAGRYRRMGKGNREVWLQATYNPVLDPSGKPIKVVHRPSSSSRWMAPGEVFERPGGRRSIGLSRSHLLLRHASVGSLRPDTLLQVTNDLVE